MDPVVPLRRHKFTFWLEEVNEDLLSVAQWNYSVHDNWWSHPDDGGPGSPEDEDATPP